MRAIETRYAGCRFRSRTEARWAVFFDALETPWEYEVEGFELPSGRYLPDFLLPEWGVWFEVKGTKPTNIERQLAHELEQYTQRNLIFGIGSPEQLAPQHEAAMVFKLQLFHNAALRSKDELELWIGQADPHPDPHFGSLTFGMRIGGGIRCLGEEPWGCTVEAGKLSKAYTAARSARFEHGERG